MKIIVPILILIFCVISKGSQAPSFEGDLLAGGKFKLQDHLKPNRVTFVSFWATWCEPCMNEIRLVRKKLEADSTLNVDVVTVNVDGPETALQINSTAKEQKISKFPIVLDPEQKILSRFNDNKALPFSIVLDSKQNILHTFTGYHEEMFSEIEKLAKAANVKKP